MGRIRILHVITQLDVGGAERQLLALCAGLPADRFRCRVLCLKAGGTLAPDFRAAGTEVVELDRRDTGGPVGQLLALAGAIRAWRPDLIQTWLSKANHVGRIAATLAAPGPVVASYRDTGFAAGPGDSLLDRLLDAGSSLVLHNSDGGRRAFRARVGGASLSPHHLLPNGIDATRFRPDPAARRELRAELGLADADPVAVMVARLHPIKDPALFLAVARRVRAALPAARFWLVGDGPLQPELERGLAAAPDPGIWLAGEREDVPRLLAAADLALLTSRSEGLSNTILEAMACGLPVCATAVGGNPELVREGVTGRLYPGRDAGGLAALVERLLREDAAAERLALGRAGREAVEESFSLEKLVANAIVTYEHLIGA